MKQEEKEIYSLIFKVALKLSQNREYSDFALNMIRAFTDEMDSAVYSFCWEFLKEYADMKDTKDSDAMWEEIVGRADEYGRTGRFQKRMMACMLDELERRWRREVK